MPGQHFELETNHKTPERIYSTTSKPWVLRLQSYEFKVVYRPRKANIADALSRLNSSGQLDSGKELDRVRAIVENSVPAALTPNEIKQDDGEELSLVKSCVSAQCPRTCTLNMSYVFTENCFFVAQG